MLYQRGKAYSQDLRERVFAASDDGERVGEVAELLRVSVAYVSKALTRRRTTGETTARSRRGHKPPKLSPLYAAIRQHGAERGDTTIEELRAWLLATHQVAASVGLIWHTLKLLGLTLKKSRSGPPSRIGQTSRRLVRNGASASRRLIRVAELTLVVGLHSLEPERSGVTEPDKPLRQPVGIRRRNATKEAVPKTLLGLASQIRGFPSVTDLYV